MPAVRLLATVTLSPPWSCVLFAPCLLYSPAPFRPSVDGRSPEQLRVPAGRPTGGRQLYKCVGVRCGASAAAPCRRTVRRDHQQAGRRSRAAVCTSCLRSWDTLGTAWAWAGPHCSGQRRPAQPAQTHVHLAAAPLSWFFPSPFPDSRRPPASQAGRWRLLVFRRSPANGVAKEKGWGEAVGEGKGKNCGRGGGVCAGWAGRRWTRWHSIVTRVGMTGRAA